MAVEEHVVLAAEVGEDLAVVAGAVEGVLRVAGEQQRRVAVLHQAAFAVGEVPFEGPAAADADLVAAVPVVAAADEKVPPAVAAVQVGAFVDLRAAGVVVDLQPRRMFIDSAFRDGGPGRVQPDAVLAADAAEEEPDLAGRRVLQDFRVDRVLDAGVRAVGDFADEFEGAVGLFGAEGEDAAVPVRVVAGQVEHPAVAEADDVRRPEVAPGRARLRPRVLAQRRLPAVRPVDEVRARQDRPHPRRDRIERPVRFPDRRVRPVPADHRIRKPLLRPAPPGHQRRGNHTRNFSHS